MHTGGGGRGGGGAPYVPPIKISKNFPKRMQKNMTPLIFSQPQGPPPLDFQLLCIYGLRTKKNSSKNYYDYFISFLVRYYVCIFFKFLLLKLYRQRMIVLHKW